MNKIGKTHLERAAYVYVRQSTMAQVQHNVESRRRQYGLADRARELGWAEVRVVDDDLARSAQGHIERSGFETLVADVCQSKVGAIFAIEVSRLARNGHEWHRLLEFCAVVGTLLVDHDGIYDPKHPNDRLLLGMKGTLSEMEVSTFRQRSREAILQKARRGEYYPRIRVGYVLREDVRLEKDPDEQVRSTIELVFAKFREFGSARQVFLWFHHENVMLPHRLGKGPLEWVTAKEWRIQSLLKDPTYAGAYAYGRTKQRTIIEQGRKRVVTERRSRPEDWEVLILDHHAGYISWQEYLQNQDTLAHNCNQAGEAVRGPARSGKGVLAGLVRCGRCGKKMQVRYGGRRQRRSAAVYYTCYASPGEPRAKRTCRVFGGVTVEQAVVAAVLEAISPARIEALVGATQQAEMKRNEKRRQLEFELERAGYEAARFERQYHAVEPENRLVARTLESQWNRALERTVELHELLDELQNAPASLSEEEQQLLGDLSEDLSRLWNHPKAPWDLKKRILRTVIREVVVYVEKQRLRVLIHWQGGQHTELDIRKRRAGEHRWKTPRNTRELIKQLARLMPDKQIAIELNRMGIRTSKGHTWNRTRVGNFRQANSIPNHTPGERESRGELTIEEVSEQLDLSYSTVSRMLHRKQLPGRQVCPGAPWIIRQEDVDALRVNSNNLNRRHGAPSPPSADQQTLPFSGSI